MPLGRTQSRKPMSRAVLAFAPAKTPTLAFGRTFVLHLWAFVLPVINLAFLVTGPHSWWAALAWTGPIWLLVLMDNGAAPDHRQPPADLPEWPFNLQLYLLI